MRRKEEKHSVYCGFSVPLPEVIQLVWRFTRCVSTLWMLLDIACGKWVLLLLHLGERCVWVLDLVTWASLRSVLSGGVQPEMKNLENWKTVVGGEEQKRTSLNGCLVRKQSALSERGTREMKFGAVCGIGQRTISEHTTADHDRSRP